MAGCRKPKHKHAEARMVISESVPAQKRRLRYAAIDDWMRFKNW